MKPARTQDQRIAQAAAYDHGYENGLRDSYLGRKSSYAWNCGSDQAPDSFIAAYSEGYRDGWSYEMYHTNPYSGT